MDVWNYLPRYKFPVEFPPDGRLFVRLETCVFHVWGPFLHHRVDPHYPHRQMRTVRVHSNIGVNAFDGRGGVLDTCLATITLGPDVVHILDPSCPVDRRPRPPDEAETILPFTKEYRDYGRAPLEAQCSTLPPMLNVRFTDAYDRPLPEGLFVEWFATLSFFFRPNADIVTDRAGGRTEGRDMDEGGLDEFLRSYLQG
jgi:hypothetical protein